MDCCPYGLLWGRGSGCFSTSLRGGDCRLTTPLPVPEAPPILLSFLGLGQLAVKTRKSWTANFFPSRKPYSSPWLPCNLVSPRQVPRPPDSFVDPGCRSSRKWRITRNKHGQDMSTKITPFNISQPSLAHLLPAVMALRFPARAMILGTKSSPEARSMLSMGTRKRSKGMVSSTGALGIT